METTFAKNPREAAYLALMAALKEETFLAGTLEKWHKQTSPSPRDYQFARQLAYGTSQMALALDYLALQLSERQKLSLKLKERVLLRLALYQHFYLERIPLYAIANEMGALAKKYCHSTFVKYLNATIRQLEHKTPQLPSENSVKDLSIRYSYPPFFIESLINEYDLETAKIVLELGNRPASVMARVRSEAPLISDSRFKLMCDTPFPVIAIQDTVHMQEVICSQQLYIQNITPATLIGNLCKSMKTSPKNILDLCAAPGGKLIAVHDFFPKSTLYANDISEEKVKRLSENCKKYNVPVILSESPGEKFYADQKFDLIILDVPCSNTGVLNKRPEARWRLSKETLSALEQKQMELIGHATTLLQPTGSIWYMTCSILKQENEQLIKRVCKRFHLKVTQQQSLLPTAEGWDGGFACSLQHDSI